MARYMFLIHQPDGPVPPEDFLGPIMRDVGAVNAEMRAAGVWVFGGGLHTTDSATTVRLQDGEVLTTDGPYLEGKEHIGGITIIEAADLDEALMWARKLAKAITIPLEVRPMYPDPPRGAPPAA
jgi:hypothetical protein